MEESKFKVGDRVKVVSEWGLLSHFSSDFTVGSFTTVIENQDSDEWVVGVAGVEIDYIEMFHDSFKLVVDMTPFITPSEQSVSALVEDLGLFRPKLEDRKVGKVPMHMVFDGFPNALQHLAEIMGWAADKKGYALHDWKNLPSAALELPAANYRHGSENSKQKAQGLLAVDRTDHESAKLHIMHQVFNLLAEAELILTGKIQ